MNRPEVANVISGLLYDHVALAGELVVNNGVGLTV
jgi:hypothetical protein